MMMGIREKKLNSAFSLIIEMRGNNYRKSYLILRRKMSTNINDDLYAFCESVVEDNPLIIRKIVESDYFRENAEYFYLKFGLVRYDTLSSEELEHFLDELDSKRATELLYEWCLDVLNQKTLTKFGMELV